jgi:low temperature requirement protein LtrA
MTTNLATAGTHTTSDRALRVTTMLALVSGSALIVDTVTITVINRSFDPLDSVLFLVGFVGMLLTTGALSVYVSRNRRGAERVVFAVGVYLVVAVALGAISFAFDQFCRHAFAASNKGLHGEWSFFSIGIALLFISAWTAHRHKELD